MNQLLNVSASMRFKKIKIISLNETAARFMTSGSLNIWGRLRAFPPDLRRTQELKLQGRILGKAMIFSYRNENFGGFLFVHKYRIFFPRQRMILFSPLDLSSRAKQSCRMSGTLYRDVRRTRENTLGTKNNVAMLIWDLKKCTSAE